MNIIKNITSVKYETLTFLSKIYLKQIHKIHLENLPNDIFPRFGLELMEKYFNYLLKYNRGKIIIARSNKKIIGFIVLKIYKIKMIKFLDTQSLLKFLVSSFQNRKIFLRLIYQLLIIIKSPKKSCEIEFFVVSKKYRSKGVGRRLIEICEKIGIKSKLQNIWTKTHNQKLANFYIKKKKAKIFKKYEIFDHNYFYVYWKLNKYIK